MSIVFCLEYDNGTNLSLKTGRLMKQKRSSILKLKYSIVMNFTTKRLRLMLIELIRQPTHRHILTVMEIHALYPSCA